MALNFILLVWFFENSWIAVLGVALFFALNALVAFPMAATAAAVAFLSGTGVGDRSAIRNRIYFKRPKIAQS